MSDQSPAPPSGPAEGDVRFDNAGRLEMFDGASWLPLQRLSDVELPPLFRDTRAQNQPTDIEPHDTNDRSDS
jgi:hypothetical protein